MIEHEQNARDRILGAATNEFVAKGFAGARMQEIADRAGVNKAMLHYYFGDKDRLYEVVIGTMIRQLLGGIAAALTATDIPAGERMPRVIALYVDFIADHPGVPRLFIQDVLAGGHKLAAALRSAQEELGFAGASPAIARFAEEVAEGRLRPVDPKQAIISLISLVVFYFVAYPVLDAVLETGDRARFIAERRTHITDLFLNGILPRAGEGDAPARRTS